MTDIAQVGIKFDSSGVERGSAALEEYVRKANAVDRAQDAAAASSRKLSMAEQQTARSADAAASSHSTLAKAQMLATKSTQGMTAALEAQQITARRANHRLGQMAYQMNDVGATLAMGMNPLMVAIQQGPQIAQIYAGNGGVASAFKDTAQMAGMLAKSLWPVALVLGAVALATAGLTSTINETSGVTVTMGDTIGGVADVIAGAFTDTIAPAIEALAPMATEVWRVIQTNTGPFVNGVIRQILTLAEQVELGFKTLAVIVGGAVQNTIVAFNEPIEGWIYKQLNQINMMIDALNQIPGVKVDLLEFDGLSELERVDIGGRLKKISDEFSADMAKIATTDYAGKAFEAIEAATIQRARDRLAKDDKSKKSTDDRLKLERQLADTVSKAGDARLQAEDKVIELAQVRLNRELAGVDALAAKALKAGVNADLVERQRELAKQDLRIATEKRIAAIRKREAEEAEREEKRRQDERLQAEDNLISLRRRLAEEGVLKQDISGSPVQSAASAMGLSGEIANIMSQEQDRLAATQATYDRLYEIHAGNKSRLQDLERQHAADVTAIQADSARQQQELVQQGYIMLAGTAADGMGAMTSAIGQALGEASGLYKAFLVGESILKVAEAIMNIQVGMSQALALPFPANIPAMSMVAAQGATIIATISQVASAFGGGREFGGPTSPDRFYEVGERNKPELYEERGRQYLIPGNNGRVTPLDNGNQMKGRLQIMLPDGMTATLDTQGKEIAELKRQNRQLGSAVKELGVQQSMARRRA